MKKNLLTSALMLSGLLLVCSALTAQTNLAPDQNPDFAISRDKYMKLADSLSQWQGTTIQQTYKAFDWYEHKQERKNERIQFNRQWQLQRNYYHYPPYYNRSYYYNNYRNYYPRHRWGFCWF